MIKGKHLEVNFKKNPVNLNLPNHLNIFICTNLLNRNFYFDHDIHNRPI